MLLLYEYSCHESEEHFIHPLGSGEHSIHLRPETKLPFCASAFPCSLSAPALLSHAPSPLRIGAYVWFRPRILEGCII